MSGARYYVWSGGRWRELDAARGAVAGWARRPRFVFARRGRLRVASRRRVLAALQAHAARRPSAVGLGPRLSALRDNTGLGDTCAATGRARCDAGTQHVAAVDVAVQHDPRDLALTLHLATKDVPESQRQYHESDSNRPVAPVKRIHYSRAPQLDSLLKKHSSPSKRPHSATTDTDDSGHNFRKSKMRRVGSNESQDRQKGRTESKPGVAGRSPAAATSNPSEYETGSETEEVCKELTISESDVTALRSYVARARRDALARFDADDSYKRMLFYAINPLVDVERCPRTERALRERHAMALPHFAARLGLAPHASREASRPSRRRRARVLYRERSTSADNDKENRKKAKANEDTDSDSDDSETSETDTNKRDKYTSPRKSRVVSDSGDEYEGFKHKSEKNTVTKTRASTKNSDSDTLITFYDNKRENNSTVSSNKRHSTSKSNKHESDSDEKRGSRLKGIENKRELNRKSSDGMRKSTSHKKSVVRHKRKEDTDSEERETFQKATERPNALRRKTATPTKPSVNGDSVNKRDRHHNSSANKRDALVTKPLKSTPTVDSESDDSDTFVKKPVSRDKYNKGDSDSNISENKRESNRKSTDRKHKLALNKTVVKNKHKENTDSDEERETFQKATEGRPSSSRRKTATPTKSNVKIDSDSKRDRNHNSSANKRDALVKKTRKSTLILDSDSDESKTFENKPVSHPKTNKDESHSKNKRELNRKSTDRKHKTDASHKNLVRQKKHIDKYTGSDTERETTLKATEDRLNSLRRKTMTPTKPGDSDNKHDKNINSSANKRDASVKKIRKSILTIESDSDNTDTFEKKPTVRSSSKSSASHTGTSERQPTVQSSKQLQPARPSQKKHVAGHTTDTNDIHIAIEHKGTHSISKRASAANLKEYSNLEDHAIVAWVSVGGRARRVNGNLVWQELQREYERLTGARRSWHSLRNRYLRYILPALAALRLPPADVSRLRAAAATGNLKRKQMGVTVRRNSIFGKDTAPRGASTRRPPPRTRSPSPRTKSPPPRTRSPPVRTRSPPPRKKSPPPQKSSPPPRASSHGSDRDDVPTDKAGGRRRSRRSSRPGPSAAATARDSPQDRVSDKSSKRKSLRPRVSDAARSPVPAGPAPGPSRTRRLFNPKLVL